MNENIGAFKRKSVAVNGDSCKKPAHFKTNPALYDMDQKLQLTSKILNNSEFALNCVQFINFISYYFEEMPSWQETSSMMFNSCEALVAGDNKCPYKPKLLDAGKKKQFHRRFHLLSMHCVLESVLVRADVSFASRASLDPHTLLLPQMRNLQDLLQFVQASLPHLLAQAVSV